MLPEDDVKVIDLLRIGNYKTGNQNYRKRRENTIRRIKKPAIISIIQRMYSFVLKDRSSS